MNSKKNSLLSIAAYGAVLVYLVAVTSVQATQYDPRYFMSRGPPGKAPLNAQQLATVTPTPLATVTPGPQRMIGFLARPFHHRPTVVKELLSPRSNWFFPTARVEDAVWDDADAADAADEEEKEDASGRQEMTPRFGSSGWEISRGSTGSADGTTRFGNFKRMGGSGSHGWMPLSSPTGVRYASSKHGDSRPLNETPTHRLNYSFFKLMG